jgi:hypothetical protein
MVEYHSRFISKRVSERSQIFLRDTLFYQNNLARRNTADVTGGKPIIVISQSISGVSADNLLVAFYDIHGRKREVLFFCSVPNTTQDSKVSEKSTDFIISLFMSSLLGHRSSLLRITHKENGP